MRKIILFTISGLVALITLALVYGSLRWAFVTEKMYASLEAKRFSPKNLRYNSKELIGLPPPVQRYFRAVLTEGQPIISAVTIKHTGTFNISPTDEQWKPFTSIQKVITSRKGFVWDGRIKIMPGLTAYVHDAYIAGEGILYASLFGLIPLAKSQGTTKMAKGELMRFLAEAAWYPTALLPTQGVCWHAVDNYSAKATLTDGQITVSLLFYFNQKGLIKSVRAEIRGRNVAGEMVPTPWEGQWWNYKLCNGIRIPTQGEAKWILSKNSKPYWRGHITKIKYEFAQ
ncbi:DUF6920 family protein [Desulfonauticus submarinus]|uniref:DUF6920 family protein n=1 Tax=Desulfonauticus submarinus TaxID=206665 RepID=UPI00190E6238|nr:DUF6544 family protein [Desulfonauticus submarinus]